MQENNKKTVPEISKNFLEKSNTPQSTNDGLNIYKAKADDYKEQKLSLLINNVIKDMAIFSDNEKIDLKNINDVKIKTIEYMQECSTLSIYPTMEELAHVLGYTEKNLNSMIANKRNISNDVIEWLHFCKEKFSALITENALKNNTNSAYSIFYQKAAYGLKDSTEVIITPNVDSNLGDIKSREEIIKELPE